MKSSRELTSGKLRRRRNQRKHLRRGGAMECGLSVGLFHEPSVQLLLCVSQKLELGRGRRFEEGIESEPMERRRGSHWSEEWSFDRHDYVTKASISGSPILRFQILLGFLVDCEQKSGLPSQIVQPHHLQILFIFIFCIFNVQFLLGFVGFVFEFVVVFQLCGIDSLLLPAEEVVELCGYAQKEEPQNWAQSNIQSTERIHVVVVVTFNFCIPTKNPQSRAEQRSLKFWNEWGRVSRPTVGGPKKWFVCVKFIAQSLRGRLFKLSGFICLVFCGGYGRAWLRRSSWIMDRVELLWGRWRAPHMAFAKLSTATFIGYMCVYF